MVTRAQTPHESNIQFSEKNKLFLTMKLADSLISFLLLDLEEASVRRDRQKGFKNMGKHAMKSI